MQERTLDFSWSKQQKRLLQKNAIITEKCARSAKIKGDWKSDPNSPNRLSRRKWKCKGSKSMK